MRCLRAPHDVVDANGLESSLVELGQPGLEQLAHGLPPLGAQLASLRGSPAAKGRPPAIRAAVRPLLRSQGLPSVGDNGLACLGAVASFAIHVRETSRLAVAS
jgi:hypothetical protein